MSQSPKPVVLAAVAHPDDIEFLFSGTLLRLKEAGCKIHMWNLLDGSCGTMTHSREEIIRIRSEEAARSAVLAGATMHPAVFPDLGVFYDRLSLAVVSAVVRSIRPQIILTHSASDYMEDHENVCRLVTSAAFSRAMPNFSSKPECPPYKDPVRIYHAPPHGLRDGLGEMFRPDFLVDVAATMATKNEMLDCHESQNAWLDGSQGMDTPSAEMERLCGAVAAWGDGLRFAEAWRRHSHLGFCAADFDPLIELLPQFIQTPNPNPLLP
jgi:N-acetylglucosamine malate deacetylase 1